MLQQTKTQVIGRHPVKPHMVQEADRDRRPQLEVFLSYVELLLMELAGVVQNPLAIVGIRHHLHLDVELPSDSDREP